MSLEPIIPTANGNVDERNRLRLVKNRRYSAPG
jgi:hypothetical protein